MLSAYNSLIELVCTVSLQVNVQEWVIRNSSVTQHYGDSIFVNGEGPTVGSDDSDNDSYTSL